MNTRNLVPFLLVCIFISVQVGYSIRYFSIRNNSSTPLVNEAKLIQETTPLAETPEPTYSPFQTLLKEKCMQREVGSPPFKTIPAKDLPIELQFAQLISKGYEVPSDGGDYYLYCSNQGTPGTEFLYLIKTEPRSSLVIADEFSQDLHNNFRTLRTPITLDNEINFSLEANVEQVEGFTNVYVVVREIKNILLDGQTISLSADMYPFSSQDPQILKLYEAWENKPKVLNVRLEENQELETMIAEQFYSEKNRVGNQLFDIERELGSILTSVSK